MLAYTPVTLKLSDQPIYAIQALPYGPRQFLVAAAGDKLWVYLVTLAADAKPPQQRQRTRASHLHTHLVIEWTPVDPPPPAHAESDPEPPSTGRRADSSGCPFQSGFLTASPLQPPPLAATGRRRARTPTHESLYTLCLLTLPPGYAGPLGLPGHVVCVTGGRAGYLHVFNVHVRAHVRVVRAGLGGDVNDIAAYPGRADWVVVACKDRTVRIVDLHLGVSVLVLGGVDGHQGQVLCVGVHPAGRWVVSGGADCAVRVWRVPEGVGEKEVRVDRCTWWTQWPHANYVDGVAFVGDEDEMGGLTVVSKSVDGEAVVWRVDTRPVGVAASGDEGLEEADRPAWATHSELNADVEERGPRPPILALLTYPPHNLWFVKLAFTYPYLALGTGSGAMAVWHLPRTLRILRARTRAAVESADALADSDSDDDDDAHVAAARTLALVVTPTAAFLDRYTTGTAGEEGAGPVVWTRKAMGKDVAGELVRMCVAVPFEMEEGEEGGPGESMDVDRTTGVKFADEPEGESESEENRSEEEGGVLLLLAGVSESGKLILSVARDQAPDVVEQEEQDDPMSE